MEIQTTIPQEYLQAVEAMKKAILHSQYQAAKGVNKIQLSLYYAIGQYVSANSRHGHWGKHAIDTISLSLQRELPACEGFLLRISGVCDCSMRLGAMLKIARQWRAK